MLGLGGFLVGVTLTRGTVAGLLSLTGGFGAGRLPAAAVEEPALAEVMLLVVSAVVTAPILEELVFRGLMQTLLRRLLGGRARVPVNFLAAAVFALVLLSGSSWIAVAASLCWGRCWGRSTNGPGACSRVSSPTPFTTR